MFNNLHEAINTLHTYLDKKCWDKYKRNVAISGIENEKVSQSNADIIISLLKVEEETSLKAQTPYRYKDGRVDHKIINPDVVLNLFVIISFHASDHITAITHMSDTIYWINSIPLSGYSIELQPLTMEQSNTLLQTLGYNMLPLLLYKIRMVKISSEVSQEVVNPISHILVSQESGSTSIILEKLINNEILSQKEKETLQNHLIDRYSQESNVKEIEVDPDDPDSEKRAYRWMKLMESNVWNLEEIESLVGRIKQVKTIQREYLIDALLHLKRKDVKKLSEKESKALNRAMNDSDITKDLKKLEDQLYNITN